MISAPKRKAVDKLVKAAGLTVVPCDRDGRYHVVGATAHYVVVVYGNSYSCNCPASGFGVACSHRIAVQWARQKEVQRG